MHNYRVLGWHGAPCPEPWGPSSCQGIKERLERECVVGSLWNVPATFYTGRVSKAAVIFRDPFAGSSCAVAVAWERTTGLIGVLLVPCLGETQG